MDNNPLTRNNPVDDAAARLVRPFGQMLRDRRRALGLTLLDVSRLVGVNRRFIGDLENGKSTCEIGRAFLVAHALGLSLPTYTSRPDEIEHADSDFDLPPL